MQSNIALYIKRSARGASRSAPLRPALCACRAARHRRNPLETEGTIRGYTIPQSGLVSYPTPQKSPPSRLRHSYRTQPRPPRSSKTVARPLGNLSDEERVHTGNVLDDLSVFNRATTVCVARHPIVHAVVSLCQRAQTFCKLWSGLPVNPVSFRTLRNPCLAWDRRLPLTRTLLPGRDPSGVDSRVSWLSGTILCK